MGGSSGAPQQDVSQPSDYHRKVAEHAQQFAAQVAQGLLASLVSERRQQFGHPSRPSLDALRQQHPGPPSVLIPRHPSPEEPPNAILRYPPGEDAILGRTTQGHQRSFDIAMEPPNVDPRMVLPYDDRFHRDVSPYTEPNLYPHFFLLPEGARRISDRGKMKRPQPKKSRET